MVTRLYNDTLEELLAIVEAVDFVHGSLGSVNRGELTGTKAYNDIVGRRWNRMCFSDVEDSAIPRTLSGIKEFLRERISEGNSPVQRSTATYKDLIEEIVAICQLPYADSKISKKAFAALRKAILTPEEILTFQAEIQKQELYCSRCQRPFVSGEAATLIKTSDTFSVVCQQCTQPTMIRCNCGIVKRVSDPFRRRIRKDAVCTCNTPTPSLEQVIAPPLPDDSL